MKKKVSPKFSCTHVCSISTFINQYRLKIIYRLKSTTIFDLIISFKFGIEKKIVYLNVLNDTHFFHYFFKFINYYIVS